MKAIKYTKVLCAKYRLPPSKYLGKWGIYFEYMDMVKGCYNTQQEADFMKNSLALWVDRQIKGI
jgi:hypothetical protein